MVLSWLSLCNWESMQNVKGKSSTVNETKEMCSLLEQSI